MERGLQGVLRGSQAIAFIWDRDRGHEEADNEGDRWEVGGGSGAGDGGGYGGCGAGAGGEVVQRGGGERRSGGAAIEGACENDSDAREESLWWFLPAYLGFLEVSKSLNNSL